MQAGIALEAEVTNISKHGLWLLFGDRELFLPFQHFPWFADSPVGQLLNVEMLSPGHFYWPDLDVDLSLESIEHPERFPLASRARLKPEEEPRRRGARKRNDRH